MTISQLDLRHTGLYSTTVRLWEDRVTLTKSKVSSGRGSCIEVGYVNRQAAAPTDLPGADYSGFHRVHRVSITNNTIDGCANDPAFLMSWTCNNSGLPGIYSQWVDDLLVSNNVIKNTALRGVQLYPSNSNVTIRNNLLRANSIAMNIGTTDVSWAEASNVTIEANVFAEQSSAQLVATYPTLRNPANGGSCAGNKYELYNSPNGVTVDDQASEYSEFTTVDPSVTLTGNCGANVRPRPGYTTSFTWTGSTNLNAAAAFVSPTDDHQTAASPCKNVGPPALRSP
ncbi:MAG: right-handed parallel beta-helix repeat-containing protein [Acidimicrobiales bacterium]